MYKMSTCDMEAKKIVDKFTKTIPPFQENVE